MLGNHRRGTSKELFAAMSNIKDSQLRDEIYGSNEPIEVQLPRDVLKALGRLEKKVVEPPPKG
jgi:hypothetical protein